MMPGNHQKLGWPGMHSPSLPSGDTLVWTSGPQNWKRLHFHCLRPSICGPLLDYKFPWAGPGPPSVQMCEGSPGIGLWESCFGPQPVSWLPPLPSPLRLSCHPSHPTTGLSWSGTARLPQHLPASELSSTTSSTRPERLLRPRPAFPPVTPLQAWPCFLPS